MNAIFWVFRADVDGQAQLLGVAEPHALEVGAAGHRHFCKLNYFGSGSRFGLLLSVKLKPHDSVQEDQEGAAPANSSLSFAGWAGGIPVNPVTEQAAEYIGLGLGSFFGNGFAHGLDGVVVLELDGACRLEAQLPDEAGSRIHL